MYQPTIEDNPTLRPDYIARLDGLTGVMRERLRYGRWVNADGAVYGESWDPSKHIIAPFAIPPEWRRIRSTDFGYVNPRAVLWIAMDHDGRMFVYRQTYQTKQKASDSGKEIIRLSGPERIAKTYCDHDADERAELEACGIRTTAANKEVSRGIQAVEHRLQAGRLFVFRGSLVKEDAELRKLYKPCSLEEEFEVYTWDRNSDGSLTKEAPEKKNDHALDALRYAVMGEDRDPAPPPAAGFVSAFAALNSSYDHEGSGRI